MNFYCSKPHRCIMNATANDGITLDFELDFCLYVRNITFGDVTEVEPTVTYTAWCCQLFQKPLRLSDFSAKYINVWKFITFISFANHLPSVR